MAPPNIRIVRVIARLNVGGPAKHVAWLTAGLRQFGFDTVLLAGIVPQGEEDMGYFATEVGVEPRYIREMSREISVRDGVAIWKLFRVFLKERPDIIHTHTAKAGTVGRIAGFLYRWSTPAVLIGQPRKCKFVHTYHGHIFHSYYGQFKTRLFILIEQMLARLTDRLIVLSEQQKTEIAGAFRIGRSEQYCVVPLGLDLKEFENSVSRRDVFRRELGLNDDVILVGIVGRLTDVKNHEFFLRCVARFKDFAPATLPPVKFVVIGEGSLRNKLEELARSLALENDVVFAGNRKDPQNFYPALDVVALSSRNEGTPLTLIEAMANARPVVATSVGGVVDLVGEPLPVTENFAECTRGISVRPGDADAFASALVLLAQDEGLRRRLGQTGRDFVERNYSKDRLLEDMRDLYLELMSTQPAKVESLPFAIGR